MITCWQLSPHHHPLLAGSDTISLAGKIKTSSCLQQLTERNAERTNPLDIEMLVNRQYHFVVNFRTNDIHVLIQFFSDIMGFGNRFIQLPSSSPACESIIFTCSSLPNSFRRIDYCHASFYASAQKTPKFPQCSINIVNFYNTNLHTFRTERRG